MSYFHAISDLFHRTIDEDVREIMGQDVIICSKNQSTDDVNRNIDLLICVLLQHGSMKIMDLSSIITKILKLNIRTSLVACRMVVLNNGKQRISFNRDANEYEWNNG